jgi:2-polyprenyl-6-methoxyphenol hydroxylase-like FAD-dependent oxidoreductase
MPGAQKALVIGGGVAGTSAAMAMRAVGLEPTIFEAHPRTADGAGSFLTVATNGIDALRALGADAPVLARGFATPQIVLRSWTGKELGHGPLGVALADGTMSNTLKRTDLYSALADQAGARGIPTEYGKRLADAVVEGQRVRAIFADGSEAVGDILIGADGAHSAARRLIDPAAPDAHYEGLLTTGGYVRGVDVSAPVGGYEMIFGKSAFFGYVPAPTGEVWWFANLPDRHSPAGTERVHDEAALRDRLLTAFADDAGPATSLIKATSDIQPLTPIHTVPRLRAWHRGPMVILGDAAHAPSPTSGQGASLSVEDAVALAWAIRRNDTVPDAFAAFERERRARVEPIVRAAKRMNSSKAAGPIGRVLRDATMPTMMRMMANSKAMLKVFNHHAEPLTS